MDIQNFDAVAFSQNDKRKFDFDPNGVNVNFDFQAQVDDFVAHVMDRGHRRAYMREFGAGRSDTQLATASACALRAFQVGFYFKRPRSANWAQGKFITITDRGVHAGDREIETNTMGRRASSVNNGVTAPDQLPERAVTLGEKPRVQRYKDVRTMGYITARMIAEGDKRGYSAIEMMGQEVRKEHEQDLNVLIVAGNVGAKLMGVTNHVDIRRRSAAFNWGSDPAAHIYDDYRAVLRDMFTSDDQDGIPPLAILPAIQYHHITTEQFSPGGTDTTLAQYIMNNTPGHMIDYDHNLRSVDSLGGPGALFLHPEEDILRVTMPYWMLPHSPWQVDELKTRILVESRFAGVQITDTDKVELVEGSAAGWAATN